MYPQYYLMQLHFREDDAEQHRKNFMQNHWLWSVAASEYAAQFHINKESLI